MDSLITRFDETMYGIAVRERNRSIACFLMCIKNTKVKLHSEAVETIVKNLISVPVSLRSLDT